MKFCATGFVVDHATFVNNPPLCKFTLMIIRYVISFFIPLVLLHVQLMKIAKCCKL